MKRNFTEFLRKCQFPPLLALGTMPIILIVMALFLPQKLDILWLFPSAYILLSIAALFLPGRIRVWFGGVGILLLLGMAFLLGGYTLWLVALAYCAMLVFSLIAAGWPWEREFPFGCIIFCTLFHAIAQVLVLWTHHNESQVLAPVSGWMIPAFLAFALLSMLSINRNVLALATMGRRKPSGFIRRKNTSAILIFFLVILAISLIPAVKDAISAILAWLKAFLDSLLTQPSEPTEPILQETMATIDESRPVVQPQDTDNGGLVMVILQILSAFLTIFIPMSLVALVVIGMIFLVRGLSKLFRSLVDAIGTDDDSDSADYTDEIDNLRTKRSKKAGAKPDSKDTSPRNIRKLPPRAQIRARYRRLLRKHPEWGKSHTAREQLPGDLAAFYERARYTQQELTVAEADTFAGGIKEL